MGQGLRNTTQAEKDAADQEKLRAQRASTFQGFYNNNYISPEGKHYYDYADTRELGKAIGHDLSQSEIQSGIVAPQFGETSLRDAQGNLKSQYTFDPTKSEAYNRILSESQAKGPTEMGQAQLNAQQLDEANQQQNTAAQNLSQLQQGQASLAQTGGLSSGARERMAVASNRNALANRQQVGMGGAQARLGILSNDANLKQNLLGQLQSTQLGAQQTNLGNMIQDTQNQALWNAEKYKQDMNVWGSGQTANAQKQAASSSHK